MTKKISIIGSGAVGSSLAFHILSRLNLKELVLLDISVDLAKGVALDLEDTRGFLNFSTDIIGTNDFSYIKDSDIIVITAGIARKEGMSRSDLLKTNVMVAKEVSDKIKRNSPGSLIITVTNPLDIITYVVVKETGFNRNRVFGMGASLDTSRLLNILFKETTIAASSFEGFVYGSHSKDMIIDLARIKVIGEKLDKFLEKQKINTIKQKVQLRGTEIVGFLKNRSAHFAPSLACFYLIAAVAHNKSEIIPVSVLLKGEYGLNDVCMGVPCIINSNGVEKIIEFELGKDEKEEINKTREAFEKVKSEILNHS